MKVLVPLVFFMSLSFCSKNPKTQHVIQQIADIREETPYVNGQIHGEQKGWYANGKLAYVRPYQDGIKVGSHLGWYESGEPRHLYEFAADQFHGEAWEWQRSGKVYRYARYEHGQEIGAKIWRSDGKIYANYVASTARLQGLPGGHLCRVIEGDDDGKTSAIR